MGFSQAQSQYLEHIARCIRHLEAQAEVFERVAIRIHQSVSGGGVLHVFGSGHSHQIAEELFHRAGGMVQVNAWLEDYLMPHAGPKQVGPLERLSGVADVILKKYEFKKGEVLLMASNSGINATSVELAEKAKASGLFTVGVTSVTHSKSVPSRSGGKKLFEVADEVIDTGTPVGDACVKLKGLDLPISPLSGVIQLLSAQILATRVLEIFAEKGQEVPAFQSANTPGGDERNKKWENQYASRILFLR